MKLPSQSLLGLNCSNGANVQILQVLFCKITALKKPSLTYQPFKSEHLCYIGICTCEHVSTHTHTHTHTQWLNSLKQQQQQKD